MNKREILSFLDKYIKDGSTINIITEKITLRGFYKLLPYLKKCSKIRIILSEFINEKKDTRSYLIDKSETEFLTEKNELKLRNDLSDHFISQEVEKIIKQKIEIKYCYKRVSSCILVDDLYCLSNVNKITMSSLGFNPNDDICLMFELTDENQIKSFIDVFNKIWNSNDLSNDVKNKMIEKLTSIFIDKTPSFLYHFSLYKIFQNRLNEFNDNNFEDKGSFKETVIYNKLYPFQQQAVHAMINKIEKFNGCILADSVGLGKTYEALAVIKYFELQRKKVLVLCPKKLSNNWNVYNHNLKINEFAEDNFNYTVLNHSDLSREKGESNGINLKDVNWSNFDLVVIDESHNFKNGKYKENENNNEKEYESIRYKKLMEEIILNGKNTYVLLLSATPINNKIQDLNSQINLITKNNDKAFNDYNIKSIKKVCINAEKTSNEWAELNDSERTSQKYMQMIGMEFRNLIDLITIARSRKQIKKTYNDNSISFPERMDTKSIRANIDLEKKLGNIKLLVEQLINISLSCYKPLQFIKPQYMEIYEKKFDWEKNKSKLKATTRENNVVNLLRTNLLKRFESSVHSFLITLKNILEKSKTLYDALDNDTYNEINNDNEEDFEDFEEFEEFEFNKKIKIKKDHIDKNKFKSDLEKDIIDLEKILLDYKQIDYTRDGKIKELINVINDKINNPINQGNKKIIIFTSYIDTANYIFKHVSKEFEKQQIYSLLITGDDCSSNHPSLVKNKLKFEEALTYFSPKSKMLNEKQMNPINDLEILIATDCISEGQNLQDCDFLINYDVHWNPVRLIQRFGRIDRIGSENKQIQMVIFWPNIELEQYVKLESRISGKMMKVNNVSTSDADILNLNREERNLVEQLGQIERENVDLEDIKGDFSLSKLTFSEFIIDLKLQLEKDAKKFTNQPDGIFSIASNENNKYEKGIIFLFKNENKKNENKNKDKDNFNQIYPYFLVFINDKNEIKYKYDELYDILSLYKSIAQNQTKLNNELIGQFNNETKYGKNMDQYIDSLNEAIESIKKCNNKNELSKLLSSNECSTDSSSDEFTLISFLIIK